MYQLKSCLALENMKKTYRVLNDKYREEYMNRCITCKVFKDDVMSILERTIVVDSRQVRLLAIDPLESMQVWPRADCNHTSSDYFKVRNRDVNLSKFYIQEISREKFIICIIFFIKNSAYNNYFTHWLCKNQTYSLIFKSKFYKINNIS